MFFINLSNMNKIVCYVELVGTAIMKVDSTTFREAERVWSKNMWFITSVVGGKECEEDDLKFSVDGSWPMKIDLELHWLKMVWFFTSISFFHPKMYCQ